MFKQKIIQKIMSNLFLVMVLSGISYSASISIISSDDVVRNGSVFQLDIVVSELNGEILSGFDMYVKYDPLIFSPVNYEITDVIGNLSAGEVIDLSVINSNEGIINIAAMSLVDDIPLQSEPFSISKINMKVIKGEGSSKFTLIDPLLINYYGEMIRLDNINDKMVSTVPEPSVLSLLIIMTICFISGSIFVSRKKTVFNKLNLG